MKDIETEDMFKITYSRAHESLLRDRGLGKVNRTRWTLGQQSVLIVDKRTEVYSTLHCPQ